MEDPTPEYIDSRIRELIATKGKPDIIFVDYIGNMTVRNARPDAKDWENQSKAIEQLFVMAKRYQIPIPTAQQINRDTIRDARKQKENNKFMSYDQAAASGGQKLMHLSTYVIAMEPYKEEGVNVFHPVKMRDAWFNPFPAFMNRDFNEIVSMSEDEKDEWLSLHKMATSSASQPATSSGERPAPRPRQDDSDENWTTEEATAPEELDLGDWSLG
jgi:hypothetical protein